LGFSYYEMNEKNEEKLEEKELEREKNQYEEN
jgi:hypothetical protein